MAARKSGSLSVANAAVLAFSFSSAGLVAASSPGVVPLAIERRAGPSYGAGLRRRDPQSFLMANEDNQYTTNVTLGTPGQTLRVQVDTGSSDLVIFAPGSCVDTGCTSASYDPSKSSTSTLVEKGTFLTKYGDGSGATGDYYADTVKLNNITVDQQIFALATETKDLQIGLIGLGYDTDESTVALRPADGAYPSFLDMLVNQSVISTKAFSMYLDAVEAPTGQILLGGYDPSKWTGNLTVVNTQASADGAIHEYFAPWTSFGMYNGKDYLSLSDSDFAVPALMDSGTSGMYLPDQVYSTILQLFGLPTPSDGSSPVGDCASESPSSAVLTFGFGGPNGGVIEVLAREMLQPAVSNYGTPITVNGKVQCELPIFNAGKGQPVIFGDIFLRSAYVVFDLDNNMLGLANTNFGAKVDDNSGAKAFPSGGLAAIPNAVVATSVTISPSTSAEANVVTSLAPVPSNFQTTITGLPQGLAAATSKAAAAAGPVAAPAGVAGLCAMAAAAAGAMGISGASLLFL